MGEFDNAHAFVDGFFAALAARAPRTQRYARCRIAAVEDMEACQTYTVNLIQNGL